MQKIILQQATLLQGTLFTKFYYSKLFQYFTTADKNFPYIWFTTRELCDLMVTIWNGFN